MHPDNKYILPQQLQERSQVRIEIAACYRCNRRWWHQNDETKCSETKLELGLVFKYHMGLPNSSQLGPSGAFPGIITSQQHLFYAGAAETLHPCTNFLNFSNSPAAESHSVRISIDI